MATVSGRQVAVGIGLETTAGTPVAPTYYPYWTEYSLQGIAEKGEHRGARGIRNATAASYIRRKYSQGTLKTTANVEWAKYAFALALGATSTATNADASGLVKDTTITVNNDNASMKTATIAAKEGSVVTERFANVVANTLSLECSDDWAELGIEAIGKFPDTTTITPAYTAQTEFAYTNMQVRFGNTLTAAASASATPLKGVSLSLNNNVMLDEAFRSGSADIIAGGLSAGVLELTGSYTTTFEDTTEVDKYNANTKQAMILTFTGGAIGTAATEKLEVKLGRIVLTNAPKQFEIDGLIGISQEFRVETDVTDKDIQVFITSL